MAHTASPIFFRAHCFGSPSIFLFFYYFFFNLILPNLPSAKLAGFMMIPPNLHPSFPQDKSIIFGLGNYSNWVKEIQPPFHHSTNACCLPITARKGKHFPLSPSTCTGVMIALAYRGLLNHQTASTPPLLLSHAAYRF